MNLDLTKKKNINPRPQTSDLQRVQQRGAASQANVRIFVFVCVCVCVCVCASI
jgi:uncharacterized MAPEG superfamily protein